MRLARARSPAVSAAIVAPRSGAPWATPRSSSWPSARDRPILTRPAATPASSSIGRHELRRRGDATAGASDPPPILPGCPPSLGRTRLPRRRPGPGCRLFDPRLRDPSLDRSPCARACLPAAASRLSLAVAAAHGCAARRRLGCRHLRAARRHLPLRRRSGRTRPLPRFPDRRLGPGLPLRHALRPLDGLRGLLRHAHAGVMGQRPATTPAP